MGVVLLVGLTVVLSSVVGVAALGMAEEAQSGGDPAGRDPVSGDSGVVGGSDAVDQPADATLALPTAVLGLSVDGDRLVFVHRAGDALDVRRLSLVIRVDGEALDHQPPVPFFAAPGFRGGPSGPFNLASEPGWEVGERASFRIAGSNSPTPEAGARVTVTVFVDDRPLSTLSVVA